MYPSSIGKLHNDGAAHAGDPSLCPERRDEPRGNRGPKCYLGNRSPKKTVLPARFLPACRAGRTTGGLVHYQPQTSSSPPPPSSSSSSFPRPPNSEGLPPTAVVGAKVTFRASEGVRFVADVVRNTTVTRANQAMWTVALQRQGCFYGALACATDHSRLPRFMRIVAKLAGVGVSPSELFEAVRATKEPVNSWFIDGEGMPVELTRDYSKDYRDSWGVLYVPQTRKNPAHWLPVRKVYPTRSLYEPEYPVVISELVDYKLDQWEPLVVARVEHVVPELTIRRYIFPANQSEVRLPVVAPPPPLPERESAPAPPMTEADLDWASREVAFFDGHDVSGHLVPYDWGEVVQHLASPPPPIVMGPSTVPWAPFYPAPPPPPPPPPKPTKLQCVYRVEGNTAVDLNFTSLATWSGSVRVSEAMPECRVSAASGTLSWASGVMVGAVRALELGPHLIGKKVGPSDYVYARLDDVQTDDRFRMNGAYDPLRVAYLETRECNYTLEFINKVDTAGRVVRIYRLVPLARTMKYRCCAAILGRFKSNTVLAVRFKTECIRAAYTTNLIAPTVDASYRAAYSLLRNTLPEPMRGPFTDFRNEELAQEDRSGVEPVDAARSLNAMHRAYEEAGALPKGFGAR